MLDLTRADRLETPRGLHEQCPGRVDVDRLALDRAAIARRRADEPTERGAAANDGSAGAYRPANATRNAPSSDSGSASIAAAPSTIGGAWPRFTPTPSTAT